MVESFFEKFLKNIGRDWLRLSTLLGLSPSVIASIKNNPTSEQEKAKIMFQKWQNKTMMSVDKVI